MVRGRRIDAIETGDVSVPESATAVDVRGMYVMPGLIDAHSHANTMGAYERALHSGVTTVRTAGVNGYADVVYRDMVKEGSLSGPDILATGIFVTPDIGDGILADHRLGPPQRRCADG